MRIGRGHHHIDALADVAGGEPIGLAGGAGNVHAVVLPLIGDGGVGIVHCRRDRRQNLADDGCAADGRKRQGQIVADRSGRGAGRGGAVFVGIGRGGDDAPRRADVGLLQRVAQAGGAGQENFIF